LKRQGTNEGDGNNMLDGLIEDEDALREKSLSISSQLNRILQ